MVTLDRWSVYSLSRCVHTLDQVELDSPQKSKSEKSEMMKIPYASTVRSLMYAMVCTWSDIVYVVEVVSSFMNNPGREHWVVIKWILWYLKGTTSVCLQFGSSMWPPWTKAEAD